MSGDDDEYINLSEKEIQEKLEKEETFFHEMTNKYKNKQNNEPNKMYEYAKNEKNKRGNNFNINKILDANITISDEENEIYQVIHSNIEKIFNFYSECVNRLKDITPINDFVTDICNGVKDFDDMIKEIHKTHKDMDKDDYDDKIMHYITYIENLYDDLEIFTTKYNNDTCKTTDVQCLSELINNYFYNNSDENRDNNISIFFVDKISPVVYELLNLQMEIENKILKGALKTGEHIEKIKRFENENNQYNLTNNNDKDTSNIGILKKLNTKADEITKLIDDIKIEYYSLRDTFINTLIKIGFLNNKNEEKCKEIINLIKTKSKETGTKQYELSVLIDGLNLENDEDTAKLMKMGGQLKILEDTIKSYHDKDGTQGQGQEQQGTGKQGGKLKKILMSARRLNRKYMPTVSNGQQRTRKNKTLGRKKTSLRKLKAKRKSNFKHSTKLRKKNKKQKSIKK